MFGWIRTSHEARVQSPAAPGLGQVEMTPQHSLLTRRNRLSTLLHDKHPPGNILYFFLLIFFNRSLLKLQYREYKRMSGVPHSRLYKWIWHWVWWLDETQQSQSIRPSGQPGPNWNTMNTGEDVLSIYVHQWSWSEGHFLLSSANEECDLVNYMF